jgi:hypothetical protein
MQKLTVKPRKIKQKVPMLADGISGNPRRRLRNALLALALSDPGWMWWVERNIPKKINLLPLVRMVERRARAVSARHYAFFGWGYQMGIIYSDFYFTDEGHLKTYL